MPKPLRILTIDDVKKNLNRLFKDMKLMASRHRKEQPKDIDTHIQLVKMQREFLHDIEQHMDIEYNERRFKELEERASKMVDDAIAATEKKFKPPYTCVKGHPMTCYRNGLKNLGDALCQICGCCVPMSQRPSRGEQAAIIAAARKKDKEEAKEDGSQERSEGGTDSEQERDQIASDDTQIDPNDRQTEGQESIEKST